VNTFSATVALSITTVLLLSLACESAQAKKSQRGVASVYSDYYAGKKTASGARYNPNALTAASPKLPMGTVVQVTNRKNGRSVRVTINDRGGRGNRIIDLSKSAARKLGVTGIAPVTLTIVSGPQYYQ
jgi:rare lipoprotein A